MLSFRHLVTTLIVTPFSQIAAQSPANLPTSERQFVAVDAAVVALVGVKLFDGTGTPPKDDRRSPPG